MIYWNADVLLEARAKSGPRTKPLHQPQAAEVTGSACLVEHPAPAKPEVVMNHGEPRRREPLAALIEQPYGLQPTLPSQGDVIKL